LRERYAANSVLHLFGGKATFGIKLDIDPRVRPTVIGDAFLPPFAESSVDVVILDPPYPPYLALGPSTVRPLLMNAAYIARKEVVWFAPLWISSYKFLRLRNSFMVRVGDYCEIRVLQFLTPTLPKWRPVNHFTHGPAVKYNRWLNETNHLPFGPVDPESDVDREARQL